MLPVDVASDELDLGASLRLVRRRIVLISVLVTLFMIVAYLGISQMKPRYYAEARLLIHKPLAATFAGEDAPFDDPVGQTSETERLMSRTAAEGVIRDLRLAEQPEFNPALREPTFLDQVRQYLRSLMDASPEPSPIMVSLEPVITEYYDALRVWRSGQGNVIHLSFDALDPVLAAAVPNRLISIYLEERKSGTQQRLSAADEWLRSRITEQRRRAVAARNAVVKHQALTGATLGDDPRGLETKELADLRDRQTRLQQNRRDVLASISALDHAQEDGTGDVLLLPDNITLTASLSAMVGDLRAQQRDLDRLLETYGSDAQAVLDLRAAISKTRRELTVSFERYYRSLKAMLSSLDREANAVASALTAAQEQRSRAERDKTELVQLQRVADEEQRGLERLEQQRRVLAGQALLPGAEIEILSPAVVPLAPHGRSRSFYLLGALLASIAVAVTAAFVAEMLDKTIRSFDQIARVTPTINAGFIPRKRKGRANPLKISGFASRQLFAEAVRNVSASLRQSNGGKFPSSVLVTSAHSGDGKSLIAASLAVELAANGAQVLLVDGDLQRGNIHSFFETTPGVGLNDYLSGQAALKDVVRHHSQSGVDFISAGTPSPHQRVQLAGITQLIEMARTKGKVVIFDSAPLLGSADTLHLAALAETTLFVVKWGKTSRRAVELSLNNLTRFRQMDIAIAINNVKPRLHARYSFSDSELFKPASLKYFIHARR
jgi:uncharacterized protein involved in exopolysaccharide biosynthesis/Mrp family chromosome partitioning ATPase